jgi:hypothetical protein
VEGVVKWTAMLVKSPLTAVSDFVDGSINLFAKLFKFASKPISLAFGGAAAGAAMNNDAQEDPIQQTWFSAFSRGVALFIDKVKSAAERLWEIIKELYAKFKEKLGGNPESQDNKLKQLLPDAFYKKIEFAKSVYSGLKEVFDGSVLGHTLKQIFGIKDNRADKIPGTDFAYDTQAYVGRGPQRSSAVRTPGHDLFNALPDSYQLPVFTALSAAIIGAITLAFSEGPLRSIILGLFTTAAGVFAANVFYDKNIIM